MINENTIKVIYKKVNKAPKLMEIKNDLETKQKLVGGLIEVVPYLENTLIICNEEGKLLNKRANILGDYDFIAGDFLVVGDDFENGDFKSLTDEEIKKVKNDIKNRSVHYTKMNNVLENE